MVQYRAILVRLTFEGLHCYPKAPEAVKFLRTLHRHRFHVKVEMEVDHSDREIEFILVQRELKNILASQPFGETYSCELMAEFIMAELARVYPSPKSYGRDRRMEVLVMEDGENGGLVRNY